ncbi:MAG: RNA-binding protein [Deltaproteobacteria bacterium]|jgi:RNA recognition motif-containing protein|nr:RNA-binding protein [Deltaproteobacteria bacterium]
MVDLFVANFPYDTEQSELETVFSRFGQVESVKIITDRVTGCSRGFGFVKMEEAGAEAAMTSLDKATFGGRPLRVRKAHPGGRGLNNGEGQRFRDERDNGYNRDRSGYGNNQRDYNYRY